MFACYAHAQHDSAAERARHATSETQSTRGGRGDEPLRISDCSDQPQCGAPHHTGAQREAGVTHSGCTTRATRTRSAKRAGSAVIVVDASVILEVLLRTDAAPTVEQRIFTEGESLHAPHLIDLEVAQVLRRYASRQELSPERGLQALADMAAFPIERYPHDVFLPRIWELRHNMTAYDAAYVALAEALGAPLLTCDESLASARGHEATVELARS